MSSPSITQIRQSPRMSTAPAAAVRLIHALLEAMAGRRALHQVRPLLSPGPFTRLASYADTGHFRRMRIGPVRAQMPTERAVEASVTLLFAARPVSCAIRLDVRHDKWVCTDLTVLHPAALQAAA
ncbi:MAG: Rv3235 family protein [Propionibacteriaceae bacterium]|nr:Rv3235 family protein [Propionibacteriaceae bacterium]